jgi:hypothetical protein
MLEMMKYEAKNNYYCNKVYIEKQSISKQFSNLCTLEFEAGQQIWFVVLIRRSAGFIWWGIPAQSQGKCCFNRLLRFGRHSVHLYLWK